jgi:hypothetical protein
VLTVRGRGHLKYSWMILPRQGFDGSGAAIDRTGQGLNRVTVSVTEPKNQ